MGDAIPLNAWKGNIQRDDKQVPRKNLTNLVLYLRFLEEFGAQLRFNEMTQGPEWQGKPVHDHDYVDIRLGARA